MEYIQPVRESTVTARLTLADRRLLELAAATREATISAFVAEAAIRAARRDLLRAGEDDGEGTQ